MGLSFSSVGRGASNGDKIVCKRGQNDLVVALAGNPNVGKSTVFNALTGMRQHTGNWPGKTVASAAGRCGCAGQEFVLVDLPGTYSLLAHSAEEEIARDFLCFGGADLSVVVCDATCLARNLNLVLQVLEICPRTAVCVNLMDEAKRKGICVDLAALSDRLGVPVVGAVARRKRSLAPLLASLAALPKSAPKARAVRYDDAVEQAIAVLTAAFAGVDLRGLPARFLALRLLEGDAALEGKINAFLGLALRENAAVSLALEKAQNLLAAAGYAGEALRDGMVAAIAREANAVAAQTVRRLPRRAADLDRGIDRVVTGKWTAYPLMLALLAGIFYLSIVGANYPSEWLSTVFAFLGERMRAGLSYCHAPPLLTGFLIDGVYRVLAAVVAVMLPPMAIFFPLFTLFEDVGLLPRIAYNLDRPFCRCHACGKQALTMCMGFGCNAAGVVGCRIIDSPRERLLAILTNAFVPCNGRFPTLIAVLALFFAGSAGGLLGSLWSALLLTALVVLGVGVTFLATRLLSATVLAGAPSAFTLELPPYRPPQIGRILVRSVIDRTLFVLGRAAAVAAPAGALLYLLANVTAGEGSLLVLIAARLDPVGRFLGLDGAVLLGFLLGSPANEIVLPIILMIYGAAGTLPELGALSQIGTVLAANGWTPVTAVCFLLFSLMHWPCATTVLTIRKETGSFGWTALAVLLPTFFGVLACAAVNAIYRLLT